MDECLGFRAVLLRSGFDPDWANFVQPAQQISHQNQNRNRMPEDRKQKTGRKCS
jgi:hypothetical protein